MAGAGVTPLPRVSTALICSFGVGSGSHLFCSPLSGNVVQHGVDQVVPKALAEEVVEEGVGNTVQKRNGLHHAERKVEHFHRVAAEYIGLKVVYYHQEHDQVVGEPAHYKHKGVYVHQPNIPSVLHIRRPVGCTSNQHIAGNDDSSGDQELENQAQERHSDEPFGVVVFRQHVTTWLFPLQKIDMDVL